MSQDFIDELNMIVKPKMAWVLLFIASVLEMVWGIFDILHGRYPSAFLNLGIGISLFSDTFNLRRFTQAIRLNDFFKSRHSEPLLPIRVIGWVGKSLIVISIFMYISS